jgi:hypothetical protein
VANTQERGRQPAGRRDAWHTLRDAGSAGDGRHDDGRSALAFQRTEDHVPSTWPDPAVPQQLHLDRTVPTVEDLQVLHARALALGARLLLDRFDDSGGAAASTPILPGIRSASLSPSRPFNGCRLAGLVGCD